jgi:hypothetical protein
VIVVAAFKSPAIIAGLDDVAVMSQPIEQRGGHLGIAKHAGLFAEGEIGGDNDGGTLVEPVSRKYPAGTKNNVNSDAIASPDIISTAMGCHNAPPAIANGACPRTVVAEVSRDRSQAFF